MNRTITFDDKILQEHQNKSSEIELHISTFNDTILWTVKGIDDECFRSRIDAEKALRKQKLLKLNKLKNNQEK